MTSYRTNLVLKAFENRADLVLNSSTEMVLIEGELLILVSTYFYLLIGCMGRVSSRARNLHASHQFKRAPYTVLY